MACISVGCVWGRAGGEGEYVWGDVWVVAGVCVMGDVCMGCEMCVCVCAYVHACVRVHARVCVTVCVWVGTCVCIASFPGHSQILSRSPPSFLQLQDKIWE